MDPRPAHPAARGGAPILRVAPRTFPLLSALVFLLASGCAWTSRELPEDDPTGDDRPLNPFYDRDFDREPSRSGLHEQTIRTTQLRPFYYRRDDEDGTEVDILGPLIRWREDEVYRRLQILPNIFYTARVSPADQKQWWFLFFPLVWLGHDDFLILPLGGYSKGFLGINEFALYTWAYARATWIYGSLDKKTRYTEHHVFWPLIGWGKDDSGEGRSLFRIAPFYGRKVGRNGVRSGFVLWPFYTWKQDGERRAFLLFPFYGRTVSPTGYGVTVMFPIYHRSVDYLTGDVDTAVYPFWRHASGSPGKEIHRTWPLHEYRRVAWTTTEYWMWPFWRRKYTDDGREFGRYTWVPPFYKHVQRVHRRSGDEIDKTLLWPLARWGDYEQGRNEVAVPAPLPFDGPITRQAGRALRPFISLYYRTSEPTGETETTAAFGIYMKRTTPAAKKVRLLWGILGWDNERDGRRYLRLFWGLRFRLGARR